MGYVYGRVVQNRDFEIQRKLMIHDKGWNLHYNPFSITKTYTKSHNNMYIYCSRFLVEQIIKFLYISYIQSNALAISGL